MKRIRSAAATSARVLSRCLPSTKRRMLPDILRVAAMILAATLLMDWSLPIAQHFDRPALAPWGLLAAMGVYAAAISHVLRRCFFPYLDLMQVAFKAMTHPIGAGLVFVGVCVVLAALLSLMSGSARAGELSAADQRMLQRAEPFLPILLDEQRAWWPGAPAPIVFAAQVEQESLWRQRAELKTALEHGAGFAQITKTARFDSLAELRAQFPSALRGWGWGDSLFDARYQLRAVVLMDYRNWRVILETADSRERMAMALAAYNGGLGGLASDRRLCQATPGCDHRRWFGHVERYTRKAMLAAHGYGEGFGCVNHRYPGRVAARAVKYAGRLPGEFAPAPNGTAHLGCKA